MPDCIVSRHVGIRKDQFPIRSIRRLGTVYLKVDADTGEEVPNEDIIKGYQVDKDRYLEVSRDELENITLESRTIEIDQFVPRTEVDDLYLVRPYYIVPDGKAGHDAYAVI
jgi:DNA end-binding protein Ku